MATRTSTRSSAGFRGITVGISYRAWVLVAIALGIAAFAIGFFVHPMM